MPPGFVCVLKTKHSDIEREARLFLEELEIPKNLLKDADI